MYFDNFWQYNMYIYIYMCVCVCMSCMCVFNLVPDRRETCQKDFEAPSPSHGARSLNFC